MGTYFSDRTEAGILLAKELSAYKDHPNTMILALPRGGVPVGFEIAKALHLPMDLMLVRKLGVPGYEEVAMGAIAIGDIRVINEDVVQGMDIRNAIERIISIEKEELLRRNKTYRKNRPFPDIKNKTVILVDDGMATGANMRAAITAAKTQHPSKIIVAVPVASHAAFELVKAIANEVICPHVPECFRSVGNKYVDFSQMRDSEVVHLLKQAEALEKNHYHTMKSKSHGLVGT